MGVALCLGLGKAGTTYFARGIDDVSDEHALLCGVLIIIIFFAFFTLFCWFFMENVPQLIQLIFDFQAQCPSWCATLENEADAMPDFGSEPRHDDEEEGYAGANEGKYGRNYHC